MRFGCNLNQFLTSNIYDHVLIKGVDIWSDCLWMVPCEIDVSIPERIFREKSGLESSKLKKNVGNSLSKGNPDTAPYYAVSSKDAKGITDDDIIRRHFRMNLKTWLPMWSCFHCWLRFISLEAVMDGATGPITTTTQDIRNQLAAKVGTPRTGAWELGKEPSRRGLSGILFSVSKLLSFRKD